jgi:hypothetical protein
VCEIVVDLTSGELLNTCYNKYAFADTFKPLRRAVNAPFHIARVFGMRSATYGAGALAKSRSTAENRRDAITVASDHARFDIGNRVGRRFMT